MAYEVIAVSDLHVGHSHWECLFDFHSFIDKFVSRNEVKHFVLLGDMIDLWRCQNEKVLLQSMEILNKLVHLKLNGKIEQIHYVQGNHDFTLNDYMNELHDEESNFIEDASEFQKYILESITFEDEFRTTIGDLKYRFVHGHQIEYGGYLTKDSYIAVCRAFCGSGKYSGLAMSKIYQAAKSLIHFEGTPLSLSLRMQNRLIKQKLLEYMSSTHEDRMKRKGFIESLLKLIAAKFNVTEIYNQDGVSAAENAIRKIAHEFIKLEDDERLVFGHTHQGGCGDTIANTGCWSKSKRVDVRGIIIPKDNNWKPLYWPTYET